MVIGNWLLAKSFSLYHKNDKVCIFASWVSNSQIIDPAIFQRETDLLMESLKIHSEKLFIYFSTCSIYDSTLLDSKYIQHKLTIENIIKASGNSYIIFRVSNPVWFTNNPHTVLNYLTQKINNSEEFVVWTQAKRNFIDIDDFNKICCRIIDNDNPRNRIINIANTKNFSILEVVSVLEKILWKKALFSVEEKWGIPSIDLSDIEGIIAECGINFDENYLDRLIQKYYVV